ncbi:Dabb family protein [Coraliomargarita sp. SDUM461004]|uniref:Dabb family protein n=1 Tax=Thalassobacterium sedimentorum TaxID=3041258 RepID=A0ABU1AKV3_9BACT|nr:Dabb family protein [Coraliomargarita sp. SDUM461004]MDQ8194470.1 Dabb family protein [Coraliomargarita sp. SDUM461004]
MLVHTVFFWLRKDLDGAQITDFRIGLETLKSIETAEAVYIGTPARVPERPVCDNSYDFCLTVIVKDVPAHDAYQAHEKHQEFIATHKEKWKKVKVYDAD